MNGIVSLLLDLFYLLCILFNLILDLKYCIDGIIHLSSFSSEKGEIAFVLFL